MYTPLEEIASAVITPETSLSENVEVFDQSALEMDTISITMYLSV